ncbi:hypothetical protein M422DRAFT_262553 [Sphaerobolus stellatus SS14]|uniref:Fungal calcium binding protein domain-containing protein n=1 Tax=Sphaerobolus stellatus (strain SS14) TaxID=990650 RepID=A0A0C9VCS8_SPHS4|nr:hypothetical protein M422DRAFT_262553 [Sphaerobolus stellatus SS14]
MQFSVVVLLSLVSVVFASPMSLHMIRDCDATTCAVDLGPTGAGCLSAGAGLGKSVSADAKCVAGIVKSAVSPPASCAGCGGGLVNDVEDAFGDAENTIEGLF